MIFSSHIGKILNFATYTKIGEKSIHRINFYRDKTAILGHVMSYHRCKNTHVQSQYAVPVDDLSITFTTQQYAFEK